MKSAAARRITSSIVSIIILTAGLIITTLALTQEQETVAVNNSLFSTGRVKINLNDGNPVINERGLFIEPGMTIKRNFFIENQSTEDVYFKIYLSKVEGGLADVLQITISEADTVLYSGTALALIRESVATANVMLRVNERRELTASFYFPEYCGNRAQNQFLAFDLCADAVQTRNNPDKMFN